MWGAAALVGFGMVLIGWKPAYARARALGFALVFLLPVLVLVLGAENPTEGAWRAGSAVVLGLVTWLGSRGENTEALPEREKKIGGLILAAGSAVLVIGAASDLGSRSFLKTSPFLAWLTVGLIAAAWSVRKWGGRDS